MNDHGERAPRPVPLTVGMEEEFLLLDAVTGHPVPAGPVIASTCSVPAPMRVQAELHTVQLELVSGVCSGLDELRRQLRLGRSVLAAEAAERGCRLVPMGVLPLGHVGIEALTPAVRYLSMLDNYRGLLDDVCTAGAHVHVGVDGVEAAVKVCNRVRQWLPTLLALFSNSPLCNGRDTGYASWRTVVWSRWPTAGPPPHLEGAHGYRRMIDDLVGGAASVDPGTVYWYVRPSSCWPTVEFRFADVSLTVEEEALLAALCRGLVGTALQEPDETPAAPLGDQHLRAACWRAARDGLVDSRTGTDPVVASAETWHAVDDLVRHVRSALVDFGDEKFVDGMINWLKEHGNGASRQRRIFSVSPDILNVIDYAATSVTDSTVPIL